jgi:hypothetical protein
MLFFFFQTSICSFSLKQAIVYALAGQVARCGFNLEPIKKSGILLLPSFHFKQNERGDQLML